MRGIKVLERILATIPIMVGIAVIIFIFIRAVPGDPVDLMMGEGGYVSEEEMEAMRKAFNLDKPVHVQLYIFLTQTLRGDLGESFLKQVPVTDLILDTLPATVELALGALIFAVLVGVPVGVISAVRQNSLLDRVSMAGSFIGISFPHFWLGIIGILIFSVTLQWLPTMGRLDSGLSIEPITGLYVIDSLLLGDLELFWNSLYHLILPSATLGAAVAAMIARVMRSSMLEVLRQDYVMLARAKGLSEYRVIVRHALRNALIPTVTVVGLQTGVLLGGNMVVETVFGWPGVGRMVVQSIYARDYPVVQGAVMLYAFTFVIANLIVDILYTYLNPKITL